MKHNNNQLVIFGATGSVGKLLVEQALNLDYKVRAFARKPYSLALKHTHLDLIRGDVFDFQAVSDAIHGCDAVLVTLGSPQLISRVRSTGTRNIVEAMQQQNVKRLVCQTTLGAGDSRHLLNFYWKYLMFGLLLRSVYNDHALQEKVVRQSRLDWTLVRPSAFIDGPASHGYQHGFTAYSAHLSYTIRRADVADFMLRQVGDDTYLHQAVSVSS